MKLAHIVGKDYIFKGVKTMIKLYTLPTCGICKMTKKKLSNKGIPYEELDLTQYMEILNTDRAPILEVDGVIYDSPLKINEWINNQ